MASPGLSELVTTTLRKRSKKFKDNMTKSSGLINRLEEKGRIEKVSGGRTLVEELMYAENNTFQWYSGYEILNTAPQDVLTAAEFDWKQASVAVTISGLEKRVNGAGETQVLNLLKSRIEVAEKTMKNRMAAAAYADGTGTSGKEPGGLQLLVPDTATSGTVGGISASTWTFWRNVSFSAVTDGGAAVTSANIERYMNSLYLQLCRNNEGPDLILADNNYFKAYLESLQSIQRITNPKLGEAGFQNLKYMNADVVLDGGYGGSCPANHMYMLNTDYIRLQVHKDAYMEPLDDEPRASVNQDAITKLVIFMGNFTISNRFMQGVLKA